MDCQNVKKLSIVNSSLILHFASFRSEFSIAIWKEIHGLVFYSRDHYDLIFEFVGVTIYC